MALNPEEIGHDNRTVKKKAKDSVFSKLFEQRENLLTLYKDLHPEDNTVTIDDIEPDTLTSVVINDLLNDLGFIVTKDDEGKIILLFEAQSKWTENLTLRIVFYLSESYRRYLRDTQQSEHTYKRIRLPIPELYIIYTGDKDVPDEISLNDDYFDGEGPVDIRVKILKQPGTDTICGQYIGFCKVYDEQRKIHKNKVDCIKETIRICIEKGYLTAFLSEHQKEVYTMMSELFDEEYQRTQYDIAVKRIEREEGRAEGRAEGMEKGMEKGREEGRAEGMEKGKAEGEATLLKKLMKLGNSIKQLSEMFEMPESEIEALLALNC